MEYDRALYRVYERIMEDLNASPSPLALTTTSSAGQNNISQQQSDGLRRRHNRSNNSQEDVDSSIVTSPLAARDSLGPNNSDVSDDIIETNNNNDNTESGDETNNNTTTRQQRRRGRRQRRRDAIAQLPIIARRQFTTATQQQRRHQPLPFIMPIWMARKCDNLHYQFDANRRVANMGNNVGIATHIWSNVRGILGVIRYTSTATTSYDSVPTTSMPMATPSTPSRVSTTFQSNYTQNLSSTPGVIIRTSSNSHRDDDEQSQPDVEEGNGGLELQTLNNTEQHNNYDIERSDSGLRRRSPTRRPSPSGDSGSSFSDSRRTSGGPPSLPTSHTSSTNSPLQPRLSPRSESSSGDVNNPNMSLTQRAIQNQQRQNDRLTSHRRRGRGRVVESDDDSNSSGSDSDDDDNSTSSSSSDESDEDTNNNTGNEGCSQYNLYGVMRLSFGVAILHIFVLISLHATYVGPYAFHKQMREVNIARRNLAWGHVTSNEVGDSLNDKETRTLHNCISYALTTRPLEERSTYFGEEKDDSSSDGDNDDKKDSQKTKSESGSTDTTTKSVSSPTPLFGMDEILQIKIMYGGKCTGRCSRVRNVVYPVVEVDTVENSTGEEEMVAIQTVVNGTTDDQHIRALKQTKSKIEDNSTVDEFSSPAYWEKVHYQFAIDDALLYLDEKAALLHNITLVNITVTERCLSTGLDDGRLTFLTATGQFLSQIYGMDSVIINQLMYGIRGIDDSFTTGYMKNIETSERWSWRKEFLESFEHRSILDWILRKIGVLMLSTLAFFLITSVTSLIVRVLTSSGVVLMFPLFTLFRRLGMPANERILAMSYPWIGSAMAAVANERIHPPSHLVWAHVTKIILYYVMYEACQAAWSVVIYHKSIPEALPVWIYGFTMIWEYFSMVFIRSALSVYFFPRLCFLYFLLYHCYFYSVPYGYFDVALIPLFMFMVHAMLYTILGLELPNAARGVINVECPREVYNRLSWQAPLASLPAEYTIFLPLNSRLSPLHDRVNNNIVPSNNNNGNRGDEASGDGGDSTD